MSPASPNRRINPRYRAYGKARLDIARRVRSQEDWDNLWKEPLHAFPFTWDSSWRNAFEYRVDDFPAEVGFFVDVLGLTVRAINPEYVLFASPDNHFHFGVVAAQEGQQSTPPDTLRIQFNVSRLLQTVAELEQRGIQFELPPQPCEPGNSLYTSFFRTPHGIAIDLIGDIRPPRPPAREVFTAEAGGYPFEDRSPTTGGFPDGQGLAEEETIPVQEPLEDAGEEQAGRHEPESRFDPADEVDEEAEQGQGKRIQAEFDPPDEEEEEKRSWFIPPKVYQDQEPAKDELEFTEFESYATGYGTSFETHFADVGSAFKVGESDPAEPEPEEFQPHWPAQPTMADEAFEDQAVEPASEPENSSQDEVEQGAEQPAEEPAEEPRLETSEPEEPENPISGYEAIFREADPPAGEKPAREDKYPPRPTRPGQQQQPWRGNTRPPNSGRPGQGPGKASQPANKPGRNWPSKSQPPKTYSKPGSASPPPLPKAAPPRPKPKNEAPLPPPPQGSDLQEPIYEDLDGSQDTEGFDSDFDEGFHDE